jgi:hypothetical protein
MGHHQKTSADAGASFDDNMRIVTSSIVRRHNGLIASSVWGCS